MERVVHAAVGHGDPRSARTAAEAASQGTALPDIPGGLPLVVALEGYREAGHVVPQLIAAFRPEVEWLNLTAGDSLAAARATETANDDGVVARFAIDELFDYRARRPMAAVDDARVLRVDMPHLEVRLLHDEIGAPFLLLSGVEPDFQWQSFADAVVQLVRDLSVDSVTWVDSVPMPVPHTRAVRLALTGNRREVIDALSVWEPRAAVPAHVMHLVEWELARAGIPVVGLHVLVPHYIADNPMPAAAVSALTGIGTATGLLFSTEALREAERTFEQLVAERVADSDEVARLIRALEAQHDAYLEARDQGSTLAGAGEDLPSADELARELESYLAEHRERRADRWSPTRGATPRSTSDGARADRTAGGPDGGDDRAPGEEQEPPAADDSQGRVSGE